jgi:hypothetical protein
MGSSFDKWYGDQITMGGRSARRQEKAMRAANAAEREAMDVAKIEAQRDKTEADRVAGRLQKAPDMSSLLASEQQLAGEETLLTKGRKRNGLGSTEQLGL